jgi:hypothetical protein
MMDVCIVLLTRQLRTEADTCRTGRPSTTKRLQPVTLEERLVIPIGDF